VEGLRRSLLVLFAVGLGTSISLAQVSLTALVLLWLLRARHDPVRRAAGVLPLPGPLLAFTAATLASALASQTPVTSLVASKDIVLVLTVWVTADLLRGPGEARRWLGVLALVTTVAAATGLVQVAACPAGVEGSGLAAWFFHRCDRARGFFSIYMTLAGVLLLILLATAPRLFETGPRRWRAAASWAVMVLALGATYTRGAWLGFAAGVVTLLPMLRRGRVVLAVILLLLVGIGLAGPYELQKRVRQMADPREAGVKERVYMWHSAVAMWAEQPWLGVGPGGVKRRYSEYARPEAFKKRTGHVHNTPLQILVERGLIGLAAWLWIWVAFYARAGAILRRLPPGHEAERDLVMGCLAAVTGFLVAGLAEYNFGDSEVVMVLWAIMALPFTVERTGAGSERRASSAGRDPSPSEPSRSTA
jgi:O-antigen ligase